LLSFALFFALCQLSYAQETEDEDPLEGLRRNIPGQPGKEAFIYNVRFFGGIFDLPTYPYQMPNI
jgi:hypothetical protein